jgi:VWFA-related protein
MRRLATLIGFLVPIAVAAQSQTVDEAPVFRLSVELVQVDAVVTDGKGNHVTTLGSEDFEVFQDGERRAITAVFYVDADERWEPLGHPGIAEAIPARPRDPRRTIALIVDDLRMSFESLARTRTGLGRFIDEHLRSEDLVSLVTTSGDATPFTFRRAELRAAASRLRYSLFARSDSILDPISISGPSGLDGAFSDLEEFREQSFAVGALGRVEEVIRSVRTQPGRKAVVLVSDGFVLFGPGFANIEVREAMRRLVDRANRAGVVIYAVDARGLVCGCLTAADRTRGLSADSLAARTEARLEALAATQDGLRYVADETGGFAVVNSNDLPGALDRIAGDLRGYYLIGFQPDGDTFSSDGRFRKIRIKVKRPGLKIRTRAGFYGVPTQ